MDELELSGRPHISAKRAAREHRYHSDYIGQLIRSGKVAGQKVGRSWYVDIESLDRYLKGEPQGAPAQPAPAVAPVVAPATPAPEHHSVREPIAASTPKPEPPMPIVVEKNNFVSAPVSAPESHPIKISKPEIPIEERTSVGLRFIPDEEPLPAVHTMHTAASYTLPMREHHEEEVMRPRPHPRRVLVSVAGATVFALLLALGASYIAEQRIIVAGESSSASIYFSFLR